MIKIKNDELIGAYITIDKNPDDDRHCIVIKIVGKDSYALGELVITDKMRVFYNHKKRGVLV